MEHRKNKDAGDVYWLDKPFNISVIVWSLVGFCVFLFLFDAFYVKHPHFDVENLFGFYGIYGFFVCIALVLLAKALRVILMRPEDYYDRSEGDCHASNPTHRSHD